MQYNIREYNKIQNNTINMAEHNAIQYYSRYNTLQNNIAVRLVRQASGVIGALTDGSDGHKSHQPRSVSEAISKVRIV